MIKVKFKTYTTSFSALKALKEVSGTISLDFETRSIYSNAEIAEAKTLLKHPEELERSELVLCKQVAVSNGLSHPKLTRTTHMIIGLSEDESIVIVINDANTELLLMDWIVNYPDKLLIHNAGFDLKTVYERTDRFPVDYEDTSLLAKTFFNHSETWKAKVGLKDLMGDYYDARWSLLSDDYTNEDFKDKDFLVYCSIDGAATVKLWHMLQEYKERR